MIVAVAVKVPFLSAVAVTVIEPIVVPESAVTSPPFDMVAAAGLPDAGAMDQLTEAVPVLPSL